MDFVYPKYGSRCEVSLRVHFRGWKAVNSLFGHTSLGCPQIAGSLQASFEFIAQILETFRLPLRLVAHRDTYMFIMVGVTIHT